MKSLLIWGMLFPLASFASIGTRGGGNARVCFTNPAAAKAARLKPLEREVYWSSIATVEVLDLFEAKLPRGEEGIIPQIMEVRPKETASAFAERVAKRFEIKLPVFSEVIRKGKQTFSQSQIVWSAEAFGKTDDIDPALHYENSLCSILGLAFQKKVNGQEKIFIDQQLFQHPKHSLLSKNVTFLHEYLYSYARANNHETSAPTREAVGLAIAVLPAGVNESEADSWGLSIKKIGEALENGDMIPGTMKIDLKDALNIPKYFKDFQFQLALTPEGTEFRKRVHEIVKVKGLYYTPHYSPLMGSEYGSCRLDNTDNGNDLILSHCLILTANANDEFVRFPTVKKELEELHKELQDFLNTNAMIVAKENIFPKLSLEIKAKMKKTGYSNASINKFQELLYKELLETVIVSFVKGEDTVEEKAKSFEKYGIEEVINEILISIPGAP